MSDEKKPKRATRLATLLKQARAMKPQPGQTVVIQGIKFKAAPRTEANDETRPRTES